MMKKTFFTLAAALLCCNAAAQDIQADNAYAYPVLQGQTQGGVFVTLTNNGSRDDILLGAQVDKAIAEKTELHTHSHQNGVMKMHEVKGGIPLPAGQTQTLKRGSYHIMLFGVHPLSEGETFPLVLKFKHQPEQTVTVTVRDIRHQHADKHHHHDKHGKHEHNHSHHH